MFKKITIRLFKKVYNYLDLSPWIFSSAINYQGQKTDNLIKKFTTKIHPQAKIIIDKRVKLFNGHLSVGKNSTLIIENGSQISGRIKIDDRCTMRISKNTSIKNAFLNIKNNSNVQIGEGVIINGTSLYPPEIIIDHGTLQLAQKVHIMGKINIGFGGKLVIGKYTGIGYNTCIRCHERINIGEYNMISYDVCIYDTNTHSTNWADRRKRIEKGYPYGASEVRKPDTKPIYIGDDVWVGKGATILKGAIIGDRSIVGIRTIVPAGNYEDDSIIVMQKPRVIIRKSL